MKDTINLLPEEGPEERLARRRRQRTLIIIGGILLAALLASLIPFLILQGLKLQEGRLIENIKEKEESLNKLSGKERLYRDVFNKTSAASVVFQSQKTLTDDIANLKSLLLSGVALSEISINKNKVKMAVQTFDLSSIISFLSDIENENRAQKFLKNLSITSVSADKFGGYQAKIEGTLLP